MKVDEMDNPVFDLLFIALVNDAIDPDRELVRHQSDILSQEQDRGIFLALMSIAVHDEFFPRSIFQFLVDTNDVVILGIGIRMSRFDTVTHICVESLFGEGTDQHIPVSVIVFYY